MTASELQEARWQLDIVLGRASLECACCGRETSGPDVHFGEEWVCGDCHRAGLDREQGYGVVGMMALALAATY